MGNDVPVIMELNLKDGSVSKFLNLGFISSDTSNKPWFRVFNGIYHEIGTEGQPSYYYIAFIMNDIMQVMKINDAENSNYNPPQHEVVWNYAYTELNVDPSKVWMNKKVARFLHPD